VIKKRQRERTKKNLKKRLIVRKKKVEKRRKVLILSHQSYKEWKWELVLNKKLSKPYQLADLPKIKWVCQSNSMIALTEITSSEIKLNLTHWLLKLQPKDKILTVMV
jgi:hypothetical protein